MSLRFAAYATMFLSFAAGWLCAWFLSFVLSVACTLLLWCALGYTAWLCWHVARLYVPIVVGVYRIVAHRLHSLFAPKPRYTTKTVWVNY